MPRLPLHHAAGSGIAGSVLKAKTIRFTRYGCANRPFYHIVVMNSKIDQYKQPIEQLGSFDPVPNMHNEKLCAINIERIQYWIGRGASVSKPVAELLGLAGFLPIHPSTYIRAWRNRKKFEEEAEKEMETADAEKAANSEASPKVDPALMAQAATMIEKAVDSEAFAKAESLARAQAAALAEAVEKAEDLLKAQEVAATDEAVETEKVSKTEENEKSKETAKAEEPTPQHDSDNKTK